jgi:uncharacterized protein DUF4333
VQCPEDIAVESGKTFTCTGTLDGQKVSYTVKETDDKGNVRIDADDSTDTLDVTATVDAHGNVDRTS